MMPPRCCCLRQLRYIMLMPRCHVFHYAAMRLLDYAQRVISLRVARRAYTRAPPTLRCAAPFTLLMFVAALLPPHMRLLLRVAAATFCLPLILPCRQITLYEDAIRALAYAMIILPCRRCRYYYCCCYAFT